MCKFYIALFAIFSLLFFQGCSKEFSATNVPNPIEIKSTEKWTNEKANEWYKSQKWLVGANYIPATAVNILEMWQADTFDSVTIEKELVLAENLGMNTMRVFLHNLVYQQDPDGFYNRINIFLRIATRHGIKTMFVLFDSVWDPLPIAGRQKDAKPFVHNSRWVQSPGKLALEDSLQYPKLEQYVKGIIGHFNNDNRILAWDIWNEPDNTNSSTYKSTELANKVAYVIPLLQKSFAWARSVNPVQPLTSGIWSGNWVSDQTLRPVENLQLQQSDFISLQNYASPKDLETRIQILQRFGKPIICTEYMARTTGSTFEGCLPLAKKYNVGMYNWGLVNGKTQTNYPWDSWQKQYTIEPAIWLHDIYRENGMPYNSIETKFIKSIIKS